MRHNDFCVDKISRSKLDFATAEDQGVVLEEEGLRNMSFRLREEEL